MSRRRTVAEPVLCACGCGEFVRRGRTYLVGHHDTPRARQLELGPNSRRRDYTGEREVRMIDCFDSYAGEAMADGFALLGQDGD
ncbi:MAG TPA: hypothetical protein PLB01_00250, partial [Thermoanaerobaculia bacterium]|nr:hypothetical protein [Thermoanaerobaculia bacterium]